MVLSNLNIVLTHIRDSKQQRAEDNLHLAGCSSDSLVKLLALWVNTRERATAVFLGVAAVALSGEKELLTKEPPSTPYRRLSSWVASSSSKTVQPCQAYSFNQASPDRSEITLSQYTKHPANVTTVSRSGAVTIPDLSASILFREPIYPNHHTSFKSIPGSHYSSREPNFHHRVRAWNHRGRNPRTVERVSKGTWVARREKSWYRASRSFSLPQSRDCKDTNKYVERRSCANGRRSYERCHGGE